MTTFHTTQVQGLNVFYRQAGDPSSPKLLLLGGFPSSSHQFRNLIPALAPRFHVLAVDYPGFGNTDMQTQRHGTTPSTTWPTSSTGC
jgi:pimeloyl-ACP methyl ester carboxylesterase